MGKDYYDPERVISRRNERLERFFELYFEGTDTKYRLIGDKNCPAVIVDEKLCLSCFVKNFNLHFTNKPNQGEIMYTVKLQKDQQMDKELIAQHIDSSEHRPVYKIEYAGTGLFLAGYNFKKKNSLEGKYPVFSRYNPKIYFSKDYAQEILEAFPDYSLQIT